MNKLKCEAVAPRGDWKYFQPETSLWFSAGNLDELIGKVRSHRAYKGIPDDTIKQDIIDQICTRVGPGGCSSWDEYYPNRLESIDQDKLTNFNSTAFNFIKSGGKLVPREEAERRAEICRHCPFNISASQCSCGAFYKLLEAVLPASAGLPGLHLCSVCGCALKAKVWLPEETIDNGDVSFPGWCWQNGSR